MVMFVCTAITAAGDFLGSALLDSASAFPLSVPFLYRILISAGCKPQLVRGANLN